MIQYLSTLCSPHPSQRSSGSTLKKGWAFSFIVSYLDDSGKPEKRFDAHASSVDVYETCALADQARTQFLRNMNALESQKNGKSNVIAIPEISTWQSRQKAYRQRNC